MCRSASSVNGGWLSPAAAAMAGMARRNRKIVNYSEFGDFEDGDEDFACIAAPLTKKSRTQPKEPKKEKKKQQKTQKELTPSQKQLPVGRTSLDDSFCERDLNVTVALSIKEKSANIHEVQNSKEQGLSPVLDDDLPRNGCRQMTTSFTAFSHQKLLTTDSCNRDHVTDSEPVTVPDEESEVDSDYSEGNDEDSAMENMKFKGNKKEIKRQSGKENKTPKSENTTTELKCKQAQKMSTSAEPVGRPLCTSSPVTNRKPKWTPPAATGTSNNSVKYASVKSPTQCLRLGLSRLARVKPLHPNPTSR
ncbi:RAD51-associated protein 1 isoform X2 [Coturnix japonica]|uniref:RAD51 associated protein 1 n=1 Tax=Coturnix japonica TaxID=93934 RepID=A0A8C2TXA0_COTJA|nr:RAD51-associated protein 1 isoform X2 [Coturnix japonica]